MIFPTHLSVRFLAVACCLMLVPHTHLLGQGRDSGRMMQLVEPLADTVGESVVQVLSGGTPVVLGTIVSADGYLLTKQSELSGDVIRVRLADGRLFPARVAAIRRANDLALLRVDADPGVDLKPIEFVGETPPVGSFLVSAGRAGRPIGIGVVGTPERSIDHRGRLGVVLHDDANGRALVQGVWPHSGADLAGIEPGDLIIAINGREENSKMGVINRLRGMFPGENVQLTILRPSSASKMDLLEMSAGIKDFGMMQESPNDSRVNGPRNLRLSGFDRVIQHDTVLDPDECGGPVLDTQGRAIGLNIARAGRVVSYALPASLVIPEMVAMLQEARSAN